jgi:hypothetical protein
MPAVGGPVDAVGHSDRTGAAPVAVPQMVEGLRAEV